MHIALDEFLSVFDNDWILELQGELRIHKTYNRFLYNPYCINLGF